MNTFFDLFEDLPVVFFDTGEDLLVEGRTTRRARRLYLLKSGSVEILKEDIQINVVSSPGSIFGEISLLLDKPPVATVRALKPTECYLLEGGRDILRDFPDLNLHVSRILAARLNAAINHVVDARTDYESDPKQRRMVDALLDNIISRQEEDEL